MSHTPKSNKTMSTRRGARKKAGPATNHVAVSNCHFEQGVTHVHHDEHTARAVESVAKALEQQGRALEVLARAISGRDIRPEISSPALSIGHPA